MSVFIRTKQNQEKIRFCSIEELIQYTMIISYYFSMLNLIELTHERNSTY